MAVILQRVFFCLFLVACDANQFLLQVEVAECYCELVLGLFGGARQFLFKIYFLDELHPLEQYLHWVSPKELTMPKPAVTSAFALRFSVIFVGGTVL